MMQNAFIALGGNMGDVLETFRLTLARLVMPGRIELLAVSSAYRTEPLLPSASPDVQHTPRHAQGLSTSTPAQITHPDFWNAVCAVKTTLTPEGLLDRLQALEAIAGRIRTVRWGPRPLDLDLLLFAQQVRSTPVLELPHPGLTQRSFVLRPLHDVAPSCVVPPDGLTVTSLLAALPDPGQGILEVRVNWC